MCVELGDCGDRSSSCNPSKDAFIVRDSDNVNVSYIDFDGSNVFVRFPAQMIKGQNIKAKIIPVSSTEFFVQFKKED